MRTIYFAAPLHDAEDQKRNAVFVTMLRTAGYQVYLPQEHGVWEDLVGQFNGDETATRAYLYRMDLHAMQQADCCVAYQYRTKGPSEGMLWEMGCMVGMNKPVFLVNQNSHGFNIMPEFGSTVFPTPGDLLQHLQEEDFR